MTRKALPCYHIICFTPATDAGDFNNIVSHMTKEEYKTNKQYSSTIDSQVIIAIVIPCKTHLVRPSEAECLNQTFLHTLYINKMV